MANAILAYVYVAGNGVRFKLGVNSEVALQLGTGAVSKIGATLWDGVEELLPFPQNMLPRRVRMTSAGLRARYVPVLLFNALIANPAAILADKQLNIEDSDGVSAVYTRDLFLGEQYQSRKKIA